MLTISKAISSGQAQTYHRLEYTSDAQSYYKQDETVKGEWQGKLAASLGLSGEVAPLEFSRLTEGMHPQTEAQMVKHREGKEYTNADGSTTKPVEHRAGWDATFSAPKSVSLTALVGGDEQVKKAHRAAVATALEELEKYTHARIGGNNPAEQTGKFIAAKFEHDTARPVNGYAAPQLHTHAIIFNVTEREDGSTRALQPQALFESQNYATAVYQSALTYQLRKLGYVAISRASEDARIYTNNSESLGQRLATDVSKTSALDFTTRQEQASPPEVSRQRTVAFHEYNNQDSRLAAVASDYARSPEKTVIVAPDRAERDELTQLIRADLYAQGKLGRDAHAVSVLVEKDAGNKMRVEGYEPGDKIQYKTGSPNGISPDSQATVIETQTRTNQLSVRLDATRDLVSYNPSERPAQTRESRIFQEETREIAEGERIRFTRYDKDLGVKSGDLGTVTRLGQDNTMTVKLDSGKTTELSPEKTKHLDYGYTVDALKNVRAERVIATGDGLTQQAFQGTSAKADLNLYTGTPAPAQEFSAAKELTSPEIAQPAKQQRDFGIGF